MNMSDGWQLHRDLHCEPRNGGALEVPRSVFVENVTLQECKAACLAKRGCTAVSWLIVKHPPQHCWLRAYINVSACVFFPTQSTHIASRDLLSSSSLEAASHVYDSAMKKHINKERQREWLARRALVASQIPSPQAHTFLVAGAHLFGVGGGSNSSGNELNDDAFYVRLAAQHPWRAILLIEASPIVARRLQYRLRRADGRIGNSSAPIIVSNTGICVGEQLAKRTTAGTRELPFYSVGARMRSHDTRLHETTDQFGSFDRSYVERSLRGIAVDFARRFPGDDSWTLERLNSSISEELVPCRTLDEEIAARHLPPPAVLLTDLEGLDCTVVAELFDGCGGSMRPFLLQYEDYHCSKTQRRQAIQRVKESNTCAGKKLDYAVERLKYSDISAFRWPATV